MRISIECSCGNRANLEIENRKYCQLRDNLEANSFRITDFEMKNGKPKEVKMYCEKCKTYVSLGLD